MPLPPVPCSNSGCNDLDHFRQAQAIPLPDQQQHPQSNILHPDQVGPLICSRDKLCHVFRSQTLAPLVQQQHPANQSSAP
eukprot:363302-Chlamydomonas_euryale.AAC.15